MEHPQAPQQTTRRRGLLSTGGKVLLLLAGCALVMWIRGYGEGDFFGWETATVSADHATLRTSGVYCARGGVGIGRFFREYFDGDQIEKLRREPPMTGRFTYHAVPNSHYPFQYGGRYDGPSIAGFLVRNGTMQLWGRTVETDRAVVAPYWAIVLLLALLPARDLVRAARRRFAAQ